MVDRATRDKCAAVIGAFLAGHADNHLYDRAMDAIVESLGDRPDPAPGQVYWHLWRIYCDFREQVISDLGPEGTQEFEGCAAFLRSDHEFVQRADEWDGAFPFADVDEYEAQLRRERSETTPEASRIDGEARRRLIALIEGFRGGDITTGREFEAARTGPAAQYSLKEPGVGAIFDWLAQGAAGRPYDQLPPKQREAFERSLVLLRSERPLAWRAVPYERWAGFQGFLMWTPVGGIAMGVLGAMLGTAVFLSTQLLLPPFVSALLAVIVGFAPIAAWAHQYFDLRPRSRPAPPNPSRWSTFPFETQDQYDEEFTRQEAKA